MEQAKKLIQDIFEFTTTELLKQGKASMMSEFGISSCLYRHPDGLKCAVGHLIDDEFYDEEMENQPCQSRIVWPSIIKSVQKKYNIDLNELDANLGTVLSFMQVAHDDYLTKGVELYKKQIVEVAEEFGLSTAFLNEA